MASDKPLPDIRLRKILYLTDLSENGRAAFPYAAAIARQFNAALTVFHVVESPDFEKHLVGYIDEALWEQLKTRNLEEARALLIERKQPDSRIIDDVSQQCDSALATGDHPYIAYDVAVDIGEPVAKILQKAEQDDYDLVVIGRHGHGAFKGALMGGTAQRVIQRCKKPVLLVEVPPPDND